MTVRHDCYFIVRGDNQTSAILGLGYDPRTNDSGCHLVYLDGAPAHSSEMFQKRKTDDGAREISILEFGYPLPIRLHSLPLSTAQPSMRKLCGARLEDIQWIISTYGPNLIVYTGAGLSRASGIWGTAELKRFLHMDDLDHLTRIVVNSPKLLCQRYALFIRSLYTAVPTTGHWALAEMQKAFGFAILTENRDRLHQQTGVPVIERHQIREFLDKSHIHWRGLMTLGVSADFSGLIDTMRQRRIPLLAIDLTPPIFLEDGDFFLQIDLQDCLPNLRDTLLGDSLRNCASTGKY